ncbi:MAG: adenylate cyclase [Paraglaciecola sp.]|jgi:adenylate cyclase
MLEALMQPLPLALLAVIAVCILALVILGAKVKQLSSYQGNVVTQKERGQFEKNALASSKRFEQKADEAMRLMHTFQKFVPKQFVDHFAKHGSSVLVLGHADEDDVAILFCDIRGFTGLSEQMSPQEVMNFLNSYFLRMNDPIHHNGGFIDKFIGDAIMALFDHPKGSNEDKATDAIRAALDLRYALNIYNQHRHNSDYPPINIGIGIHFGPVIIGTVGSDDRMDTTVIGDSVNLAYRLEKLAPVYQTDIVVSAQMLEVAQAEGRFESRLLDWVKVKGRLAALEIHEVLDHLPDEQKKLKLLNANLIKQGINYRKAKDWLQALSCFEQALSLNPQDYLATHHLAQCRLLQQQELPANWDGALQL